MTANDFDHLRALAAEYAALSAQLGNTVDFDKQMRLAKLLTDMGDHATALLAHIDAKDKEIAALKAENATLAAGNTEKPYRQATIYDTFPATPSPLAARIKAALLADDVRGVGSNNSGCYGVRTDYPAPNGDVADAYFWHIDEFQMAMLVGDPLTPQICERAIAISESFESVIPEDGGRGFGIGAVAVRGHDLDGPRIKGYGFEYATGTMEWSIWRVWRKDTAAQIAAESEGE